MGKDARVLTVDGKKVCKACHEKKATGGCAHTRDEYCQKELRMAPTRKVVPVVPAAQVTGAQMSADPRAPACMRPEPPREKPSSTTSRARG